MRMTGIEEISRLRLHVQALEIGIKDLEQENIFLRTGLMMACNLVDRLVDSDPDVMQDAKVRNEVRHFIRELMMRANSDKGENNGKTLEQVDKK